MRRQTAHRIPTPDDLGRWLAAEEADRGQEAEELLAVLFGALPMAVPSPAFADRVIARLALVSPRNFTWRAKSLVAISLMLAALALGWLPAMSSVFSQLVSPAAVIAGSVNGLIGLVAGVGELFSQWQWLLTLRQAFVVVATAPPIVGTMLTIVLLATLAYRWIQGISLSQRNVKYAEAH